MVDWNKVKKSKKAVIIIMLVVFFAIIGFVNAMVDIIRYLF